MRFFVISDTHGSFDFPEIQADCLLLLGDMSKKELQQIDTQYNLPTFFVYGNNDTLSHTAGTNIQLLHEKVVDFHGVKLAGFGGIPRYSFKNAFYEWDEEDVSAFTSTLSEVDIFLAHANPMMNLSWDMTDPNRGFYSFTSLIETIQPSYFLHGHLHQAYTKTVDSTHVVGVYQTFSFEL